MLTRDTILVRERWQCFSLERRPSTARPNGLYLVTEHEIQALEAALEEGRMPVDFERKLCRLGGGGLIERYVAQNCRLIFSLLLAARQGLCDSLSDAVRDRLLRVLAYVRKDEDAIPDYRVDGFKDDAQEIRSLEADLGPVLQEYKRWRLRHQVPGIWLRADAQPSKPREAASRTWGS
ncbi:MAG TPA: hypothetical protein VJA21_00125 [Verrucomicrobiae bacterium]